MTKGVPTVSTVSESISMFDCPARIVDQEAFADALGMHGLNLPVRSRAPGDVALVKRVGHACTLILGDYAALRAREIVPDSPGGARADLRRIWYAAGLLAAPLRSPAYVQRLLRKGCETAAIPDTRAEDVCATGQNLEQAAAAALQLLPPAGRHGPRTSRANPALDLTILQLLGIFRFHFRRPRRLRSFRGETPAQMRNSFVLRMLAAAAIDVPASVDRRIAQLARELDS
jgi:hypothetical protein